MEESRFRWRNLPHWEITGATYFVTFRLAGSLPAAVVEEWRQERERLRRGVVGAHTAMTEEERKRLSRVSHEKFDAQLDRAEQGPKHLTDPRLASLVVDALRFHASRRYDLYAYVVMPNHVHLVMRPLPKANPVYVWGLDEIMRSIKGYTGKKANELRDAHGEFWQREYFDHLIRDEEEWWWYVEYTHLNPVRAELCARPEDWAWSSARLADSRE
jgi:REP-associated tyrosine transposase